MKLGELLKFVALSQLIILEYFDQNGKYHKLVDGSLKDNKDKLSSYKDCNVKIIDAACIATRGYEYGVDPYLIILIAITKEQ